MSSKLWAFRDAAGTVRITPTDPSSILAGEGLQVATATVPGGFSMRDLRRHFETTESTLAGNTGRESYIEFTILDLEPATLMYLMTPSEPQDEPASAVRE